MAQTQVEGMLPYSIHRVVDSEFQAGLSRLSLQALGCVQCHAWGTRLYCMGCRLLAVFDCHPNLDEKLGFVPCSA